MDGDRATLIIYTSLDVEPPSSLLSNNLQEPFYSEVATQWFLKHISLQSGRYTLSYLRGRYIASIHHIVHFSPFYATYKYNRFKSVSLFN